MKEAYAIHPMLIYIHVVAGTVALLAGTVSLVFRKGSLPHKRIGNIFFVSMLIMAGIGAYGAYFIPETLSSIVGVLTFYLVATAWIAARKHGVFGNWQEALALITALLIAGWGYFSGWQATQNDDGTKDGFPAGLYFFFSSVALLAALLDLHVIVRKKISYRHRLTRHLWRMCFAMLIATASVFLGQPQVFPEIIRKTSILAIPVLALMAVLIFWLLKVSLARAYRKR